MTLKRRRQVIAALPIVAEAEGRLLVDITATFSTDIDGLTAAQHIVNAGVVPAPIGLTVDPARSYISAVNAYPDNLHVRSHVTFRAQNPAEPAKGFQPVSIELGHSLIMLPEHPMTARRYDDRVGFFFTRFAEFEDATGEVASDPLRGVISRFRLEKADPSAAVSDPVEPIVFYIGQGVPERWRPYLAAAVESWEPVFRAAGFSNAIVARQAPAESVRDRLTRWAAGESGSEERWMLDPRVQRENVGTERIEATRLGLKKVGAAVADLDRAATDDRVFRRAYAEALSIFGNLMGSVTSLVGGRLAGEGGASRPAFVPASDQQAAVSFLLTEGAAAYDALLRPALVMRADAVSGDRIVDAQRARWVRELLSGPRLALLHTQQALDPGAYGVSRFAADVTEAVWGTLEGQPAWRAAQQEAYLDSVEKILHATPNASAADIGAARAAGFSEGFIAYLVSTGQETVFPAYVRDTLPLLKARLDRAARDARDDTARLHLRKMSDRIDALLKD